MDREVRRGSEARAALTADDLRPWFPRTGYYENHLERLAWSFSALPELAKGFKCLCLGSWGGEVPFIKGWLGAGDVFCVRAPEAGGPSHEQCLIEHPSNGEQFLANIYAIDLEKSALPNDLKSVDLVICWELLEHLKVDPPRVLWQALCALRLGGYLSVTTPNALWHYHTTAQLFGTNSLGLRLQPHRRFATHWRLYSPSEVSELCEGMGGESIVKTSFLRSAPFSIRSRVFLALLRLLRKRSGNGECSYGQHVYVLCRKAKAGEIYRPEWLFPKTKDRGGVPVSSPAVESQQDLVFVQKC